jgi:glycosyltransferase involved in cell wall biosynthesis
MNYTNVSTKMKIAFLHQPNDPYTQVRIKYFVSRGHDVYSIVFNTNKKQKPITGLNVIYLPDKHFIHFPFMKRLIYGKVINDITSKHNIDILYVISALNSYYIKASSAKNNILEIQGSDVIRGPKKFPFLKLFYKYYWIFADAITQDSMLAQEMGFKYGASKKNNKVIEIGVDFSIFNKDVTKGIARERMGINKDDPIVFSSRGMKSIYNIATLIKTIPIVKKRFSSVKFVFASNYGNLPDDMKKFINLNNLNDNIIFTGWLDHEKEMPYYNRDADVMVSVPSSDSSPFSVYEAMATMTPVIVTDLPWLKDKFIHGKHLVSVPVRDEKTLSVEIINVLGENRSIDKEAAYKIVFEKINMEIENLRLENLMKSLMCKIKL